MKDSIESRKKYTFRKELQKLINRESMENGSNTPDFLLAEYLADCLAAFDRVVSAREKWYGREPEPVCPQPDFPDSDKGYSGDVCIPCDPK